MILGEGFPEYYDRCPNPTPQVVLRVLKPSQKIPRRNTGIGCDKDYFGLLTQSALTALSDQIL
jgi:hypothetical protein